MLPVTIQHPDGVVYHFYRSDQLRRPKGQRVIFPRNNEAKAAKLISLFKNKDLIKVQTLLSKKQSNRLTLRKALVQALTDGQLYVYEERSADDVSEAEMALLRLDIKLLLKQIVSIEKGEAAKIEKDLEDKNTVEKILIYKHEYNKGFAKAAIELLTWVKDIYEVVSPTENLKRALDAGWETYKADSKDWQETFYAKLKASNYKEVVDALGFDPSKLSKEQIVQVFTFAQLISEDEKTQEIILEFGKEYIGAQHSLEWANFAGGAAFDIVLTALLAFFTAGVGAAASIGAKAGRLMKPLAKLGEKFSELAKKLSKKFKPKKKKKTKVGGTGKGEKGSRSNNKGPGGDKNSDNHGKKKLTEREQKILAENEAKVFADDINNDWDDVKPASGARKPGTVDVIVTKDGQVFKGYSSKKGHPDFDDPLKDKDQKIKDAYSSVPESERMTSTHGKCAEVPALQKAIDSGADLDGAVSVSVEVKTGVTKNACKSCSPALKSLGVKDGTKL